MRVVAIRMWPISERRMLSLPCCRSVSERRRPHHHGGRAHGREVRRRVVVPLQQRFPRVVVVV